MNKRSVVLISSMMILLGFLVGCASSGDSAKCKDIVAKTLETADKTNIDTTVVFGEEIYENNFDRLYNFAIRKIDDGAIAYASTGGYADEISIVHVGSEKDKATVKGYFQVRIQTRIQSFTGYKPKEVQKLENAKVIVLGDYVVLIICDNVENVETAIRQAINGN